MLRVGRAHARHQQTIDRGLLKLIDSLEANLEQIERLIDELSARNDVLAGTMTRLAQQTSVLVQQASGLAERTDAVERRLPPLEELARGIRAVPDPEAVGLERFEAPGVGSVIGYRQAAALVSPENDYVAFEDVFRLSEDVIRERQRPYLALLNGREPVLDAGCGRGEFLELLRDAGVAAQGVDLDPGMVARARAKGLDVEQSDLIAHLARIADSSLGAVFSAQVVEHLPYAELVRFLRLGWTKLKPGGLLIAETVNPHAPAALKAFWTDPTHQHPIFPEVLLTLCKGFGFSSAYIFHPAGSGDVDADRGRFGDYAIVAERGAPALQDEEGVAS
jgi:SAM-dependent methyltransferase